MTSFTHITRRGFAAALAALALTLAALSGPLRATLGA